MAAQLPELGALPSEHCERTEKAILSSSVLMHEEQQRRPQARYLSLGPALLCRFYQCGGFSKPSEPFLRLPSIQ
jgi:hypothetical protein